jgi:hypothetical protein
MNKILLAAMFILPYNLPAQTCIVIVRGSNKITIGMDSRAGFAGEPGVYDTICKIRKYHNIYMTAAGMGTNEAYAVAMKSCKEGKNLDDIVSIFMKYDTIERMKFLNMLSKKPFFASEYASIKTSGIAFCSFENNVPKVIVVQISIISKVGRPIVLETQLVKEVILESTRSYALLGHYDLILKKELDDYFINTTTEKAVENMISLECDKDHDVGKPINILDIYNDKYKWVKNPVECGF